MHFFSKRGEGVTLRGKKLRLLIRRKVLLEAKAPMYSLFLFFFSGQTNLAKDGLCLDGSASCDNKGTYILS